MDGKRVILANGKRGLLANGKAAITDVNGHCNTCCSTNYCTNNGLNNSPIIGLGYEFSGFNGVYSFINTKDNNRKVTLTITGLDGIICPAIDYCTTAYSTNTSFKNHGSISSTGTSDLGSTGLWGWKLLYSYLGQNYKVCPPHYKSDHAQYLPNVTTFGKYISPKNNSNQLTRNYTIQKLSSRFKATYFSPSWTPANIQQHYITSRPADSFNIFDGEILIGSDDFKIDMYRIICKPQGLRYGNWRNYHTSIQGLQNLPRIITIPCDIEISSFNISEIPFTKPRINIKLVIGNAYYA